MPYELKDALKILESGRTCNLSVVKLDTKKKTGGEYISYRNCRIARRQQTSKKKTMKVAGEHIKLRNPHHNFHFTRNIQLANGAIRTIHVLFIESLNNIQIL